MAKKARGEQHDGAGKDDGTPRPPESFRVSGHIVRDPREVDALLLGNALQMLDLADRVGALEAGDVQEGHSQPAPPPATYTVREAADLLGRSPDTIRRWIRLGKLRSTKSTDSQQGQHLIPYASLAPFFRGR
jgi:excisionase family DNA binding protein